MTTAAQQKALLIAAFVTIGITDIAFGMTLQLQPLVLELRGVSASMIGTVAAVGSIGAIIAGPVVPGLVKRFGSKTIVLTAMLAVIAVMIAMPLLPPLYWWFPLRMLLGLAIASLFTVTEAWVTMGTTDQNRGRIMGLYTSMLSLTFAAGPLLLPFTGIEGYLPWLICAMCVLLGILALTTVKPVDTSKDEGGSFWSVYTKAPLLFACVLTATTFDSVYISFFTIFAMRNGVPLSEASWLLGVGIAAGALFFYPMGMLADKWSKHGLVIVSAIVTIALALLLPSTVATFWAWPILMLFTTSAFGVYVVALAVVGDVFKGNDVVTASAGIAAMWGLGGLIGPPLAGWLIDGFGVNALPMFLAGIYGALLVLLAVNGGRIVKPAPA